MVIITGETLTTLMIKFAGNAALGSLIEVRACTARLLTPPILMPLPYTRFTT